MLLSINDAILNRNGFAAVYLSSLRDMNESLKIIKDNNVQKAVITKDEKTAIIYDIKHRGRTKLILRFIDGEVSLWRCPLPLYVPYCRIQSPHFLKYFLSYLRLLKLMETLIVVLPTDAAITAVDDFMQRLGLHGFSDMLPWKEEHFPNGVIYEKIIQFGSKLDLTTFGFIRGLATIDQVNNKDFTPTAFKRKLIEIAKLKKKINLMDKPQ